MLNTSFVVILGDKEFSVRSLSLLSVIEAFQKVARKHSLDSAKEIAQSLPPQDRGKFMLDVWQKIPKEYDITEIINQHLSTFSGIREILKNAIMAENKIDESELNKLIEDNINVENLNTYVKIAMQIIGLDIKEDKDDGKKKEVEVD
jgi:hypothetical protein